MLISDLIERGMRCPNCGGVKIRGGYHDWQRMDSFICEGCGLHWQEDFPAERFDSMSEFDFQRFIWVMADGNLPLIPILNTETTDDCDSRQKFIMDGIKWRKGPCRRK